MTKTTSIARTTIKEAALTVSAARLSGGLYYSVRQLSVAFSKENVNASVFTMEGAWGERLSQEELDFWKPLNLHVFPCHWPRKLGYSPKLLPALKETSPNIIHCHGLWHYHLIAASRYCRQNGIPWVVSPHGMLDEWALRNKGWKKLVARKLYHDAVLRNASCIRALCGAEVDAIRQSGCENPICLIPNGVELPDEQPDVKVHASADSLAHGKRILLFLGRIAPKKGLVNLLRAWKTVQRSEARGQMSEWVLAIAGMNEGGHEAELKRLATELEILWADVREKPQSNSISAFNFQLSAFPLLFLGPQHGSAKNSLFDSASAFILPSFSEGLPMAVLEAWAHRLPVLMTPHCNLPEGFSSGAAIRIEPNTESIAQGLHSLFQSSISDLQSTGSHGRVLVSEHFTWPRIASQMREVYDWMLGGGRAPACMQFYSAGEILSTPSVQLIGQASNARFRKHNEVKSLFDQKAMNWSRKYARYGSLRPRLYAFEKQLSELLKPSAAILDFGCGTGNIARHLSARGYAVSACDISCKMIEWAEKNNPKSSVVWRFIPPGWDKLPFLANSFDAITASSVFEYLADIDIALPELWRILKPGGYVIATVPNSRHFARKLENVFCPMVQLMANAPVLNRFQKLNSYAMYLRCSQNRMPLEEWFSIANQLCFEVAAREKSFASNSALVFLLLRKPESKSKQPLKKT